MSIASEKILLDTDIGSDLDDAVCLAYLLAQPRCELLGITTVTGEAEKRAMMVSTLCKIAGYDIPIYPGAEHPLLISPRQPVAQQAVALKKWAHDTKFPRGEAIEFLRTTIRAHPGEITLLAIGPLTNIALLFATDPEIPRLLKRLVLMCGQFKKDGQEWNALNDPHATAMVYEAPVRIHRSIGLDVTLQVQMNASEFRTRCEVPLLRPVLDFAEIWFQRAEKVIFHDPLAAVSIFDEGVCTFTPGRVTVEHARKNEGGKTHWLAGTDNGRHEVATGVDTQRFFDSYFSVFE